ncbi:MAG TPA: hypothetical protein VMU24_09640 [Candidatus Acidoferrales bacterium]|nr:hypothetical protein [Candidatus Acidoferrales bacterium]
MTQLKIALSVLLVFLTLTACNSGSSSKPAESKSAAPPANEYITGRSAYQKLFIASRTFAPDVKPYRIESRYTPGDPVQEGKAGVWTAQFASGTRGSIKSYTWSGLNSQDAPERGITPGSEDTYNPSNTSTQVFDNALLKVDSDKAFQVAQEHGGAKIVEKDPKQPVRFILQYDNKAHQLVWHVIYGTSTDDAKLRVAVDATSGDYIRTEH